MARCTRCSRRSSTMTRFQCGYCTPGQICSAAGLIAEGRAHRRRRDSRTDERQHLPLRRLSQHRCMRSDRRWANGDRVMIRFQYVRANDVADAVRMIAARPGREIHRRRNQSAGPDERGCRAALTVDRYLAAAAEDSRGNRRRRTAGRRARAEFRPRLPPAGDQALSGAWQRDPCRRIGAVAQHGIDRRQSAPAHALPVLL